MDGAKLISAERKRQIEVEGWSFDHDDHHRAQIAAHLLPNSGLNPKG